MKILDSGIIYRTAGTGFGYNAWPSVARLDDGTLAVSFSGNRLAHICPYGQTVLCVSRDGGKTWSDGRVINDTALDDRDSGILNLGGGRLMVTFFCHSAEAYESRYYDSILRYAGRLGRTDEVKRRLEAYSALDSARRAGGSHYIISTDNGLTWGGVKTLPVSAPHGASLMSDGTVLYVGKEMYIHESGHASDETKNEIKCYKSTDGGESFQEAGTVPLPDNISYSNLHEPHAVELPDGSLLCAIRAQDLSPEVYENTFTVFLSRSSDGGATWTVPEHLDVYGSPPHILVHSSGKIIITYGHRKAPHSVRVVVSGDNGRTWSEEKTVNEIPVSNGDMGYPCSVETADGSVITVYYQICPGDSDGTSIVYSRWSLDD